MKKCRVLELIGGSLSDGGAETLVKEYVLHLDNQRFESAVFVDWVIPGTANYKMLTEAGETIFTVYPRYNPFWRGINKFLRGFLFQRKLKKVVRDFNPDVIHVHLFALEYLSKLGDVLTGRRILYTCHSTPDAIFGDSPLEEKAAGVLVKDHGLRFIALHKQMAEELNSRFGVKNTVVVNNGIDISRFKNVAENKISIRESLGIPKDAFVIGHVGRFSAEKNHEQILKVFESVREVNDKAFLLLVGAGERRSEIEEEIKGKGIDRYSLILSGRNDIHMILKAMDVFLFPSIYEGLGIALIEAQASGLRCIVSDTVPPDAFVSDNVVALDLNAPVVKWRDAVLDTALKGKFLNRIHEYDINSTVHKLEQLYLEEI